MAFNILVCIFSTTRQVFRCLIFWFWFFSFGSRSKYFSFLIFGGNALLDGNNIFVLLFSMGKGSGGGFSILVCEFFPTTPSSASLIF